MFRFAARSALALLLVVLVFDSLTAYGQEARFAIPATDDGLPGDGPIRRYKWFQDLWQRKRSDWAKQIRPDQGAVVFLGDSITQGWGPNMGDAFRGMKVANRGISGDTTRGMLVRLQEDVLSLNPSGVVMLMGTNDLEEDAAPKTIAGNFELIVEELKKHNHEMPIVVCNVFPSSATKKRSSTDIKEVNRLYQNVVKGDPQITVVDTWTLFANAEGDAKKAEFPDLLHPNKLGYHKWAGALRPVFATLGFLERDADTFEIEPGYVSLFNGHDLDGWMYRPSTEQQKKQAANWQKRDANAPPWPIITEPKNFDDQTATPDGRYVAINDRLVVTTPSEGRKIQQFWTQQEFPHDFNLKLEFRATPNADSGIFLRGKQLQCRDYALAGPYKDLKSYRAGDWNEISITVRGQSAYCTCNGEVIETDFKIPKTGPIGLEGDRGQIEYRRIRVKQISDELPRTTPEAQGVSSAAIMNFVDALENIDTVHSFMLLRHGNVVAEGWWKPFTRDDPHQLYSLSKSFASTAVGLAINEGKLTLDDLVISFFTDELPEDQPESSNLSRMRVRDLLTMSTGHDGKDLKEFKFDSDEVLTKKFLALPVQHGPGTHFVYNTPATYMCSAIVQKVTGEKVVDYLKPRLFAPLGIEGATWSESPQGVSHGGFGLNIRTEDIARFGQLYLQGGEWNGRQLVPSEWVEMATSKQTSNGSDPNNDWNQGYGFQFWRCRHNCYRGDGAFGQFCIVMPDHDAVLAVNSGASNMGAIMQATWEHLLPGFSADALPNRKSDSMALKERLEALELGQVTDNPKRKSARSADSRQYILEENALGIESVRFAFDENPALIVKDATGEHRMPIGTEGWLRNRVPSIGKLIERLPNADDVAIATNGAWTENDTFQFRMWLYESPFRVDVVARFSGDDVFLEVNRNVGFGPKQFELKGATK